MILIVWSSSLLCFLWSSLSSWRQMLILWWLYPSIGTLQSFVAMWWDSMYRMLSREKVLIHVSIHYFNFKDKYPKNHWQMKILLKLQMCYQKMTSVWWLGGNYQVMIKSIFSRIISNHLRKNLYHSEQTTGAKSYARLDHLYNYDWLVFSNHLKGLFFVKCAIAYQKSPNTLGNKQFGNLVKTPLKNYNKLNEDLTSHAA